MFTKILAKNRTEYYLFVKEHTDENHHGFWGL